MFTGLVESVGILRARQRRGPGARLTIDTGLAPLVDGESIAVQGVCLTVDRVLPTGFEADASGETLDRTTLGGLAVGAKVHLERAVPLGGRMGGHIISGHVDGVVRLVAREVLGEALRLCFGVPKDLARFVAEKGSVAIDGVSLTVNGAEADRFDVVIIPHTQGATHLGALRVGQDSNLEVDVLARYVERLLSSPSEGAHPSADERLTAKLRAAGFLQ